MQFLLAFLPGAGVLKALLDWADMICWPTELVNNDPVISQYELICNFVLTSGIQLPRLRGRNKGFPVFADPVRDEVVCLLPAIGEDSIRILQLAIRHVSSVYNVELFPRNYFARRPYLRSFGHRPLLSGYLTRPVLPNHLNHLQNFPQWVTTTGFGFPEPVVGLSIDSLQREGFESHTWSHEDRAKFSNKYMQRIWYWQRRDRS